MRGRLAGAGLRCGPPCRSRQAARRRSSRAARRRYGRRDACAPRRRAPRPRRAAAGRRAPGPARRPRYHPSSRGRAAAGRGRRPPFRAVRARPTQSRRIARDAAPRCGRSGGNRLRQRKAWRRARPQRTAALARWSTRTVRRSHRWPSSRQARAAGMRWYRPARARACCGCARRRSVRLHGAARRRCAPTVRQARDWRGPPLAAR